MILAVDIGNTTVSLAVVKNQKVIKSWQVMTRLPLVKFKQEFRGVILPIRKSYPFEASVICSVVPSATKLVKEEINKVFKVKAIEIGKDIFVPMKNLYRHPKEVGQDRLVGAYAAMTLYGKPLIIIDFGTAVTFDVVSQRGEYMGGAIVPGLRLFAESLFEKTALLPKVRVRKPKSVIGRDTEESILSGLFYGYGALCDGMNRKISGRFDVKPRIVVTGGNVEAIKSFLSRIDVLEPSLIFKGIEMVYRYCRSA